MFTFTVALSNLKVLEMAFKNSVPTSPKTHCCTIYKFETD